MRSIVREFQSFIMRGNVLDLAVGIIIGAAFTAIVNSLVQDIINPILGLFLGRVDFTNIYVALDGKQYASIKAARDAGGAVLAVGSFIQAIINFVIVAIVVFFLIRGINTMMRRAAQIRLHRAKTAAGVAAAAHEESLSVDQQLLTEIRDLLRTQNPREAINAGQATGTD